VISETVTPVQCFELNNGQISLVVTGGTGAYTYLWSDGNTSQNRTGLAPGTYSVTVTDANNCTQSLGGLEITQPAAALSLSETHVNVLCFGGNNGSIDLTVSGGTTPYTYSWTKTGSTFTASTEDISELTAGTYNVTVTDARLCTATLSVVITQPAALVLNTAKVDPSCPPDAQQNGYDGSITLSVSGGNPIDSPAPANYTYAWSYTGSGEFPPAQANSKDLTNVPAGTYTVMVTDANGCTATTSVTLVEEFPTPQQPAVINH
jgi:large repetitive protein